MLQNKCLKVVPEADSSSTFASIQEMATFSVDEQVQTEPDIPVTSPASTVDQAKIPQDIFNENLASFKDAVTWSGFIDKSMLIAELLNNPRIVLVFAPRRFGKSLNMDMVKCFFEIEDIENPPKSFEEVEKLGNYKAFCRIGENGKVYGERCKILNQRKIVEEYFGKHPVVYLNLKNIRPTSVKEVEDRLRAVIRDYYAKHFYLIKSGKLSNSPVELNLAQRHCQDWCDPDKYVKQDINEGLEKLVEYLHAYHGQKVYLLVDEFDALTVKGLLANKTAAEVKNIGNLIGSLLGTVLKGTIAQDHVLGALVTGISFMGSVGFSDELNNINAYQYLRQTRFADYYGLKDEELTLLLENTVPKLKRKDIRKNIEARYNGYYAEGSERLYCVWSVLHYIRQDMTVSSKIRSKKSRCFVPGYNFWAGSGMIHELAPMLGKYDILGKILTLLGNGQISFIPSEKFEIKAILNILTLSENAKMEGLNENVVFTFLMEQGYLSFICEDEEAVDSEESHSEQSADESGDASCIAKIPNTEIMNAYTNMFIQYVVMRGFSTSLMDECASVFCCMTDNVEKGDARLENNFKRFYEKVGQLFEHFKTLIQKDEKAVNERAIQAVLYVTMLKAKYKICYPEKYMKDESPDITEKQEGYIDLWMYRDRFAVIWELKYNPTASGGKTGNEQKTSRAALEEILGLREKVQYAKILDQQKIRKYLLVGLSMNGDCQPSICSLANSRAIKDCISFPK